MSTPASGSSLCETHEHAHIGGAVCVSKQPSATIAACCLTQQEPLELAALAQFQIDSLCHGIQQRVTTVHCLLTHNTRVRVQYLQVVIHEVVPVLRA